MLPAQRAPLVRPATITSITEENLCDLPGLITDVQSPESTPRPTPPLSPTPSSPIMLVVTPPLFISDLFGLDVSDDEGQAHVVATDDPFGADVESPSIPIIPDDEVVLGTSPALSEFGGLTLPESAAQQPALPETNSHSHSNPEVQRSISFPETLLAPPQLSPAAVDGTTDEQDPTDLQNVDGREVEVVQSLMDVHPASSTTAGSPMSLYLPSSSIPPPRVTRSVPSPSSLLRPSPTRHVELRTLGSQLPSLASERSDAVTVHSLASRSASLRVHSTVSDVSSGHDRLGAFRSLMDSASSLSSEFPGHQTMAEYGTDDLDDPDDTANVETVSLVHLLSAHARDLFSSLSHLSKMSWISIIRTIVDFPVISVIGISGFCLGVVVVALYIFLAQRFVRGDLSMSSWNTRILITVLCSFVSLLATRRIFERMAEKSFQEQHITPELGDNMRLHVENDTNSVGASVAYRDVNAGAVDLQTSPVTSLAVGTSPSDESSELIEHRSDAIRASLNRNHEIRDDRADAVRPSRVFRSRIPELAQDNTDPGRPSRTFQTSHHEFLDDNADFLSSSRTFQTRDSAAEEAASRNREVVRSLFSPDPWSLSHSSARARPHILRASQLRPSRPVSAHMLNAHASSSSQNTGARRGPRGNQGLFPPPSPPLDASIHRAPSSDSRSTGNSHRLRISDPISLSASNSDDSHSFSRGPGRSGYWFAANLRPSRNQQPVPDRVPSNNRPNADHGVRGEPYGRSIPNAISAARRSVFIDQMRTVPNSRSTTPTRIRDSRNFRGVYNFRPVPGSDFSSEVEEIDDEDYQSQDDDEIDVVGPTHGHVPSSYRRMAQRLMFMSRDFNDEDYEMLLELDERDWRPHGLSRGVSQSFIRKLPTYEYARVESDNGRVENSVDRCCVCLDDFEQGTLVRVLPCKHEFCECVERWLLSNPTCPVCRSKVCRSPDLSRSAFSQSRAN